MCMDINSMSPASGQIIAEDGSTKNIVNLLGGGSPVSNKLYDINQFSPRTGRIIGEDGKLYNLVDLLENGSGGGGENFAFIPDRANRVVVLNTDGTWTATADGFVQRSATITHPNTAFAIFRLYQNDVIAWAIEHSGLLSTGLYEFTSETIPVQAGDSIRTESSGGGIASTLWYIPPRIVIVPEVAIDDFPTENSANIVRSGGVFKAIQDVASQIEKLDIDSTGDDELTILQGSAVKLGGGGFFVFDANMVIDASNLDVNNSFSVGMDYYIYICKTSGSVTVIVSPDGNFPAGYDETNSRKIGGFHYGVNRRDTAAPGNIYTGVVPRSVWTLFHRPKCAPEGMVYLTGGVWVDIYLSSDDGAGGLASKFNAPPISGLESLTWYSAIERLGIVGKRPLFYSEFIRAAAGSPPGTGSGNLNAWTSGSERAPTGFVANAVSSIGCRDCVGNLWEWLSDIVASGIGETPGWFNPMSSQDQLCFVVWFAMVCSFISRFLSFHKFFEFS